MTIAEMNQIKRELGVSYQEICLRSGVPIGTVQKVLGGITKNPRVDTMMRLEETLGEMKSGRSSGSNYPAAGNDASVVREAVPVYGVDRSASQGGAAAGGESHLYTAAERDSLPDDRRTELIDGILYDMTAPSLPHQDVSLLICRQIQDCIREHHSKCHVFIAPADVCLDRDPYTVIQPDVFIVCDRQQITRKNIQGAPAFVLEVLSPSTEKRDKDIKFWKYLHAGVREYWMIDPDHRQVTVFDMTGNYYGEAGAKALAALDNGSRAGRTAAEKALLEEQNPYNVAIYGFSDRIPLAVSKGKCVIDMNQIRETLDELYS